MFHHNMTKRKWRRARGKIIAKYPNCKSLRKIPYRHGWVFEDIIQALLYTKPIDIKREEFEFGVV